MTVRPDDLRGEARASYDMWRNTFGLSEQSALAAVAQDGLVEQAGIDRAAAAFRSIFGLSVEAARTAARGRNGPSSRPVSEGARSSASRPQPGDALRVVRKIEELASDLCRRGVQEEKALREAAFAVFQGAPDDQIQEWVAQVTGRRWPELWGRSSSTSGSKGSPSGRTSGTVRG